MLSVSRRSFGALTGAAGTAALVGLTTAGCDDATGPAPTGPSADEALVSTLITSTREVREVARAAAQDALVAMHTQHLIALGDSASVSSASPSTPTTSASPAPGSLRASEERLRTALADAAVAAEAGSLARMTASMAAAVAQRLVVLRG